MHPVIDTLMREHRIIESVLEVLGAYAQSVRDGAPADRATLERFAEFFSRFADRRHHGKEEDVLFAALRQHGMPVDRGPLGVMLAEHDEGRRHVRAIASLARGSGPLTAEEQRDFVEHARAFVPLLGNHIVKEDNVLYPMAERLLPDQVLQDMAQAFDTFERENVGPDENEELHGLTDTLTGAAA